MIGEFLGWISQNGALIAVLTGISILSLVGTILLAPLIVSRIPADYFSNPKRSSLIKEKNLLLFWTLIMIKNLLGVVIILLGALMLITPGPGIVLLIAGLVLVDYPGKYRLERYIVSRPAVLKSLNWMRRKASKPPLKL